MADTNRMMTEYILFQFLNQAMKQLKRYYNPMLLPACQMLQSFERMGHFTLDRYIAKKKLFSLFYLPDA